MVLLAVAFREHSGPAPVWGLQILVNLLLVTNYPQLIFCSCVDYPEEPGPYKDYSRTTHWHLSMALTYGKASQQPFVKTFGFFEGTNIYFICFVAIEETYRLCFELLPESFGFFDLLHPLSGGSPWFTFSRGLICKPINAGMQIGRGWGWGGPGEHAGSQEKNLRCCLMT